MAEPHRISPFRVAIAGTQSSVRDGLAQTMAYLATLNLPEDEASTVELVLAEALNNTVEHALAHIRTETRIEIRGRHSAEGLDITIIDQGVPMPDGALPVAKCPDLNVDTPALPEGGFGWFIIHSLARNVVYVRIDKFNCLSLHLDVGLSGVCRTSTP